MECAAYDRIGRQYATTRQADPRIAAKIEWALGDATSVLNVGAGTGSYEPAAREVTAVEPSATMIAQRPADAAPAVQASAEALPFDDSSFDAVLALLSDHHWQNRPAGLREMRRVARKRVIVLNVDPAQAERFWLTRDYLPGFLTLIPASYRVAGYWQEELEQLLGEAIEARPVGVPHDCRDGFYPAHWRRPHAYLDPRVRDGISVFHRLPNEEVDMATERLAHDLDDGSWEARWGKLLALPELDVGLRLAVASLSRARGGR